MSIKSALLAAATALLFAQASGASAAVVSEWNWNVTSQFVTSKTKFTSGNGTTENTAGRISWGQSPLSWPWNWFDPKHGTVDPSINPDRSGIAWTTPLTQSGNTPGNALVTNGNWVNGNSATHYNRDISATYKTLKSGEISTTLNLYVPPGQAPGGADAVLSAQFDFLFVETPNGGGGWGRSGCAIGAGACPDIFILKSGDLTDTFAFDGVTYTLEIDAFFGDSQQSAFQPLNHKVCGFSQVASLCGSDPNYVPIGFITPENADTTVQFRFRISADAPADPIPEPATLTLFGAALAGLGVIGRRRKA